MHPTKTPGQDGMSPIFFHKYWHTIGDSIAEAILQGLNSGEFSKNLNLTFVTLIPKKKNIL